MQSVAHSSLNDPEMISENKQGQLTAKQRVILKAIINHRGDEVAVRIGMVATIVLFGLFGFTLQAIGRPPEMLFERESPLVLLWGAASVVGAFIVGFISKQIWSVWYKQKLNSRHSVTKITGQVKWRKDKYVASTGLRTLRTIYDELDLPPGHYEFYLFQGSNWLVGATLKQGSSARTDELLDRLRSAHGVVGSALLANQNGRLTAAQRIHLVKDAVKDILVILIMFPIMFGSLLFFITREDAGDVGLFEIGIFAVLIIFFGVFLFKIRDYLRDFQQQNVNMIQGEVGKKILHADDPDSTNTYLYLINGMTFTVSQKAYQSLVEGLSYKLYYLPHSKKIVNIELNHISETTIADMTFEFA